MHYDKSLNSNSVYNIMVNKISKVNYKTALLGALFVYDKLLYILSKISDVFIVLC